MSYSELIKDYSRVRDYMREFFAYGFKSRVQYEQKSPRSYDNERRRVESWFADYMAFRQDSSGKNVFISVDSRHVSGNPLYKAWKTASFTKNDISLHFVLLDILSENQSKSIREIFDILDRDYMAAFSNPDPIDESTLRKKLKEYEKLGLVTTEKQGKQLVYGLSRDGISLEAYRDSISFFSEENPLGVIGSFLLDKYDHVPDIFAFKHHYILFALDCGVMLELLTAIREHRTVEIELFDRSKNRPKRMATLPMKIYISAQGGRQYLAGFDMSDKKLLFFRLDNIEKVRMGDVRLDYDTHLESLREMQPYIWGAATGNGRLEHIEMTLRISSSELHIARRLEREKRCGTVKRISEDTWRFSADVYDSQELLPWLRTFIGRIESLVCSNKAVEEQFWFDYELMTELYT